MEWFRIIPNRTECFPVAYPLREKRRKESMPSSLKELAFQIASENENVFTEKPCILYGHCEGGVIAYETAVAIKKLYGVTPRLFVASGVNPPCVPLAISIDESMSLEDASKRFVELRFIPEQFANNATYLNCFVPVLLEDFILFQKYCDTEYQQIDCPILEIHGSDDPMIQGARTHEWRKYTTAQLRHSVYPGEHFYASSEVLPKLIAEILE